MLNAFFTAPLRRQSSREQSLGQTSGPRYASSSPAPCRRCIFCMSICEREILREAGTSAGMVIVYRAYRYARAKVALRHSSLCYQQCWSCIHTRPFSPSTSDMDHTRCTSRTAESFGAAEALVHDASCKENPVSASMASSQDNRLCMQQTGLFTGILKGKKKVKVQERHQCVGRTTTDSSFKGTVPRDAPY